MSGKPSFLDEAHIDGNAAVGNRADKPQHIGRTDSVIILPYSGRRIAVSSSALSKLPAAVIIPSMAELCRSEIFGVQTELFCSSSRASCANALLQDTARASSMDSFRVS